jgi:hypothetical protein
MCAGWFKAGNNFSGNIVMAYQFNVETGDNCRQNVIIGQGTQYRFGFGCMQNILYGSFDRNSFGDRFTRNIVGNALDNTFTDKTAGNVMPQLERNSFGAGLYDNRFGVFFINNSVGDRCSNNRIGASFDDNVIGADFKHNRIGTMSRQNIFGDYFNSSELGNDCQRNTFGANVSHIVMAGNGFLNVVGDNSMFIRYGLGCHRNVVKDGCSFVEFGENGFLNVIGENGHQINLASGCQRNVTGMDCVSIHFGINAFRNEIGNTGSSVTLTRENRYNTVSSRCHGIMFMAFALFNTVGDNSTGIHFDEGCMRNRVEDTCYDVRLDNSCMYNRIESNVIETRIGHTSQRNRIKNGSTGIRLGALCMDNEVAGNNNTLEEQCRHNTIPRRYQGLYLHPMTSRLRIGQGANPNILDNGDFTINQRGVQVKNDPGMFMDRWEFNGNGSMQKDSRGFLRLESNGADDFLYLQKIEHPERYYGEALTLSVENVVGALGQCAINTDGSINTIIKGPLSAIGYEVAFMADDTPGADYVRAAWDGNRLTVTLRNGEDYFYGQQQVQQALDAAAGGDPSRALSILFLNQASYFGIHGALIAETAMTAETRITTRDWLVPALGEGVYPTRDIDGFMAALVKTDEGMAVCLLHNGPFASELFVRRMKLERGRYSTLYDDTVNETEALTRCQRFCVAVRMMGAPPGTIMPIARVMWVTAQTFEFALPLPGVMRATPSLEEGAGFALIAWNGAAITANYQSMFASGFSVARIRASGAGPHGLTDATLALMDSAVFSADL